MVKISVRLDIDWKVRPADLKRHLVKVVPWVERILLGWLILHVLR